MNAGYGKNWPKVLNLTREPDGFHHKDTQDTKPKPKSNHEWTLMDANTKEESNRRLTQTYADNFSSGSFLNLRDVPACSGIHMWFAFLGVLAGTDY
jgi:hypothetical protein